MSNPQSKYVKTTLAILSVWFVSAITASVLSVFKAGSALSILPPLPLGFAVAGPILAFLLWFSVSAEFRRFVLALDARVLTFIQSWRVAGFTFLVLYTYGILPREFALPAGWGDIAIGATAPLVGLYLSKASGRKRSFIAWQRLGMLDLVTAVTLGVLCSPTPFGILARGVTTDAMTVLPLSLIPTFAVPLLLIFHIICIAQARGWESKAEQTVRHGAPRFSLS